MKVPALPANAPCEIEAIAYKEPVHIWRDAAKEAGCVIYLRCCFVPRGFCASIIRVCAPRKTEEQKLDLAECLGALVAGAHLSLAKAGLREEHWCRLRVFIPEATSCAAVHALLEDLLEGEDVDPPAGQHALQFNRAQHRPRRLGLLHVRRDLVASQPE